MKYSNNNKTILRALYIFLICIFGLSLIIPLILSNKVGEPIISEAENRYLASFPELTDSITNQYNPQFYTEFENWLNDNIGLREQMVKINSNIDFSWFNVSTSNSVYIGRNDWCFYADEDNLLIASDDFPLTEKDYANIAASHAHISQYLAQKNIDYFVFLAPSKVSIYPEEISVFFRPHPTPIDVLTNALQIEGVHCINPKPQFLAARDSLQLYFKRDTHWSYHGIEIAHQLLVDTLRKYNHFKNEIEFRPVEIIRRGDLAIMLQLNEIENSFASFPIKAPTVKQDVTELLRLTDPICNGRLAYNRNECYISESLDPNNTETVLFIGDSFGIPLSFLVSEHCHRFIFVRGDIFNKDIVEWAQPDLVIFLRSERGIPTINIPF